MGIILFILLGGIAGITVWLIMDTQKEHGIIGDILLGGVGALVGGIIMGFAGLSGITGFNIFSFTIAIIASVTLIGMGRLTYKCM